MLDFILFLLLVIGFSTVIIKLVNRIMLGMLIAVVVAIPVLLVCEVISEPQAVWQMALGILGVVAVLGIALGAAAVIVLPILYFCSK